MIDNEYKPGIVPEFFLPTTMLTGRVSGRFIKKDVN